MTDVHLLHHLHLTVQVCTAAHSSGQSAPYVVELNVDTLMCLLPCRLPLKMLTHLVLF